MSQESIIDIASYLRAHASELSDRILNTFPPLQSTKDPVAPRISTMLRKALPAQALVWSAVNLILYLAHPVRV
jgi:hypothetical protein